MRSVDGCAGVPRLTGMEVLEGFDVSGAGKVELCAGDLTAMAGEDAVDLLVISAFPDDYTPTKGSLVGALSRIGVSVAALAAEKHDDLRATSSCWISRTIPHGKAAAGFGQLMCYEPSAPVTAAETVGDVFRALVPFVGSPGGISRVAMPVLATGDQHRPMRQMLGAILEAATGWMGIKLPLALLRIVVRPDRADEARREWLRLRLEAQQPEPRRMDDAGRCYDAFISYAREDGVDVADQVRRELQAWKPSARIFVDRNEINVGASWQQAIYDCLNACRKVVVVLTPGFLGSKVCEEELNLARLRDRESPAEILFPLYVRSAELQPHIRMLNYRDCREAEPRAIRAACAVLAGQL